MNKPLVVWAGDLHINSMAALCPPRFRRDGGHANTPPAELRALWDAWLDAWKNVYSRKREVIAVFGGEFADLDAKERTNHIISKNTADIREAVAEALQPALKQAAACIVLRGTEAHSGLEAEFDELVARDIVGVPVIGNEATGEKSWWHLRITIGGKRFDLAHHARMGTSFATEKNAANAIARQVREEYAEWGEPPPDWILRGHVHRVSDSGINYLPTRAVTCPCWSLANPHTHRIGAGGRKPQIGLIVIDTMTAEPEWIRYDIRRPAAIVWKGKA